MGDEAGIDQHRIVRLVTPERRLAVDDERAHRRAESLHRQHDRFRERRFVDAGNAGQRVAEDVELELRLRLGRDVLPPAAAAAFARVDARRDDARGRGFEHLEHAAAEMIGPVGGHLDPHALAGEGAVDQRHPAVVGASERIAAGNHASRRQLHQTSEARSLRDWRIVQALRVHELGEPEQVMSLEDGPEPVVGPGEVRLRVHAAALNFPDVLMCRGEYQVKPPLPFTPGAEVAGVVDEVGAGVDGFRVGDRVLAIPNFGPRRLRASDDRKRGGRGLPDPGIDAVRRRSGAARRLPDRAPCPAPPCAHSAG